MSQTLNVSVSANVSANVELSDRAKWRRARATCLFSLAFVVVVVVGVCFFIKQCYMIKKDTLDCGLA